MSILDKGIYVFYGFVDLTPEQSSFIAVQLGYKNLKELKKSSDLGDLKYHVGYYEEMPVRSGEYAEANCIGIILNGISDAVALIDQVPVETKKLLQRINDDIYEKGDLHCEHVPTSFGTHVLYHELMD